MRTTYPFLLLVLLSFLLTGCASSNPEGEEAYGDQLGQQTKTMSKNIGSRTVQKSMNKVGNATLKRADGLLGKLGL